MINLYEDWREHGRAAHAIHGLTIIVLELELEHYVKGINNDPVTLTS